MKINLRASRDDDEEEIERNHWAFTSQDPTTVITTQCLDFLSNHPNIPFFFFFSPDPPKIESNVLLVSTLCELCLRSFESIPSGFTPEGKGRASKPTLINEARLLAVLIGLALRLPGARRPGPGDGARKWLAGDGTRLLPLSSMEEIGTLRTGGPSFWALATLLAASCSCRAELRMGLERVHFSAICQQWLRR